MGVTRSLGPGGCGCPRQAPNDTAKRALKAIGVGDFYEFKSNSVSTIRKETLRRSDELPTQAIKLRENPERESRRPPERFTVSRRV